MEFLSFAFLADLLSELSFKDILSLGVISYQLIGRKLQSTSAPEADAPTSMETDDISASSASLPSIFKENAKSRVKALIQNIHNVVRGRQVLVSNSVKNSQ